MDGIRHREGANFARKLRLPAHVGVPLVSFARDLIFHYPPGHPCKSQLNYVNDRSSGFRNAQLSALTSLSVPNTCNSLRGTSIAECTGSIPSHIDGARRILWDNVCLERSCGISSQYGVNRCYNLIAIVRL
jgi:hypothetical protein